MAQIPPLDDVVVAVYDPQDRPFEFSGLTFDQLPKHAQTFLIQNGLAHGFDGKGPFMSLPVMFHRLMVSRGRQLARLDRALSGVHDAIVSEMMEAKSKGGVSTSNLRDILIPEWRGHLDDHLTRSDAMVWVEMTYTEGIVGSQSRYQQQLEERKEAIHHAVIHVIQRLHETFYRYEKLERTSDGLRGDHSETSDDDEHCHDLTCYCMSLGEFDFDSCDSDHQSGNTEYFDCDSDSGRSSNDTEYFDCVSD